MVFHRKFWGLSKDEQKMLELKKLKEGKTYAEAKHEIKRDVGVVIRTELKTKAEVEEYKETHKSDIFKDEFDKLRHSQRNNCKG